MDIQSAGFPLLWDPLLDPLFWRPDRLGVDSAWWGHVPFAFWLVTALRPSLIVELGTYTGASYAAFCKAVEKNQLSCRCFAVDTWAGDDQTGYYSEEIFSDLRKFNNDRYSAFSVLLRERFDSAVQKFEDRSIDLLHIDGFHTYEAVRQDFETWLPKLSERGVVLFHDSNEYSADFGVWRLIHELRERFPVFEFLHSHGLAVVAIGEHVPRWMNELCGLSSPAQISQVRERFTFAGTRWMLDMQQARDSAQARTEAASFRAEASRLAVDVKRLQDNERMLTQALCDLKPLREEAVRRADLVEARESALRDENKILSRQVETSSSLGRQQAVAVQLLQRELSQRQQVAIQSYESKIDVLNKEIENLRQAYKSISGLIVPVWLRKSVPDVVRNPFRAVKRALRHG